MNFNEIVAFLEATLSDNKALLGESYSEDYDISEYKNEQESICESITNKHISNACEILLDYSFKLKAINEVICKRMSGLESSQSLESSDKASESKSSESSTESHAESSQILQELKAQFNNNTTLNIELLTTISRIAVDYVASEFAYQGD